MAESLADSKRLYPKLWVKSDKRLYFCDSLLFMEPYTPEALPPQNLNYEKLISLVGKANAKLAEYNGLLQGIINPEIMLSLLETQEAVSSSKIEGTQASFEEVLEFEAGNTLSRSKEQDIEEIINYRKAMPPVPANIPCFEKDRFSLITGMDFYHSFI